MLLKGASLKVYRDGEKVILLCKFWRNYKIGRSKGQQDRYIFIEKLKFYFNFLCRNYWVPGRNPIGILEIGILQNTRNRPRGSYKSKIYISLYVCVELLQEISSRIFFLLFPQ